MDENQVMSRVVAMLADFSGVVNADDWEAAAKEASESNRVGDLISEILPALNLPAVAKREDVARIIEEQYGPVLVQLVASFSEAWLQLAAEHDEGNPDVTSSDILRQLGQRSALGEQT